MKAVKARKHLDALVGVCGNDAVVAAVRRTGHAPVDIIPVWQAESLTQWAFVYAALPAFSGSEIDAVAAYAYFLKSCSASDVTHRWARWESFVNGITEANNGI